MYRGTIAVTAGEIAKRDTIGQLGVTNYGGPAATLAIHIMDNASRIARGLTPTPAGYVTAPSLDNE